jgi:2,3,4,5-tetrahydropyridine-2-carboxylate N-succinyltransferase
VTDLAGAISTLFEQGSAAPREAAREVFVLLRTELGAGRIRAAEPDAAAPGGWRVNAWVKQGIVLGLRFGDLIDMGIGKGRWPFFDADTMPLKTFDPAANIRIAPGGSTVREGAYLGTGVVCMPPMYINIGAYVGDGTLVDSHALIGSCAQVGRHVHVGAAAQIGGGVEPVDVMPVIVEDGAIVAPGTIVTASTAVYDLPNERILAAGAGQPLVISAGAVVVPGARAVTSGAGRAWGLSLATPVIVSYGGGSVDARAEIERWIR